MKFSTVDLAYAYSHNQKDAVARALAELAGGLACQGFDTRVVRPRVSSSVSPKLRGIHQIIFAIELIIRVLIAPRPAQFLILVDIPTGLTSVLRAIAAVRPNSPRIINWALDLYRMQDMAMNGSTRWRRTRQFLEVSSLKCAHEVVVLGSCMQTMVQAVAGRESKIIPIWHADVVESTVDEIEDFRSQLGFTSNFLLLYSGRAGTNHPLKGLIHSMEQVERAGVDLLIAGQGPEFEEAHQLAISLRLDNCHFLPPVPYEDVGKLLRVADWHIASLAPEATGTCVPSKVYASMSVGKPVLFLGSENSQAALDINAAGAGIVADPSDVISLMGVIDMIASDPGRGEAMGASGKRFFCKNRTVSAGTAAWAVHLKQWDPQ